MISYKERSQFYDLEFQDQSDFELLRNFTVKLRDNAHILDIPCGSGRTISFWENTPFNVVLADICTEMVRITSSKINSSNLNALSANMENINAIGTFDVIVILREAFMFLNQDKAEKALDNISQALNTNGQCLIDLANLHCSQHTANTLPEYIAKADGGKYLNFSRSNKSFSLKRWHTSILENNILNIKFDYELTKASQVQKLTSLLTLHQLDVLSLEKVAKRCGLKLKNKWGNYKLSPWSSSSPRTILLLEKVT